MDIDRHAPITASGSVDISASPGEVWALLADIARWPSWNPEVTEARLEGELRPGTTFVWRSVWARSRPCCAPSSTRASWAGRA